MSTIDTIHTDLGDFRAHNSHLTTHYSSPIVARTLILPDDGVTVNGVTYSGHVGLEVYVSNGRGIVDTSMMQRKDEPFSWGTVTDAARRRFDAALAAELEALAALAADVEWRREYVAAEVRRKVLSDVRSVYRNAYRTASDLGERESVNADAIALEVLTSLTREDLTAY